MTLPREDMLTNALPEELTNAIKNSHFFVVTKALSAAGVMRPGIVKELEKIEDLDDDKREIAFAEFMKGVEAKMASSSPDSASEEVFL